MLRRNYLLYTELKSICALLQPLLAIGIGQKLCSPENLYQLGFFFQIETLCFNSFMLKAVQVQNKPSGRSNLIYNTLLKASG